MPGIDQSKILNAFCGHIVSPSGKDSIKDLKDGVLVVDDSDGTIVFVGTRSEFEQRKLKISKTVEVGDKLIMPGMIDTHIHLPQVVVTGKSGEHLLKWLERFVFPSEIKCADRGYAHKIASWFFDEMLRNGTTCGVVFTTIHKQCTDIAFEVASERGLRAIMGKVMMNANAPAALTEDLKDSLKASAELCEKWHGHDRGRLLYAFTPRFAVTSTSALLTECGKLWRDMEGTYIHTHLAESLDEMEFVKTLYPSARSYVDVYLQHCLLGRNSIMAHSIHLDDQDLQVLKDTDTSLSHCPSSNFFLKSGVFGFKRVESHGVRFGLGSDVAAGPQFSMFCVMKDANYMQMHDWLKPIELFYRATLGGAEALGLEATIGSLDEGKEADFIIVDPRHRSGIIDDILQHETDEILSALVFLGDDRVIDATYVRGKKLFSREGLKELRHAIS